MKYKKIDPNAPPQDNGAAELKKVRIKRGLLTAGVFVVLMGLFEALVALEWKPVYPIYLGAMTVLLLLFLWTLLRVIGPEDFLWLRTIFRQKPAPHPHR